MTDEFIRPRQYLTGVSPQILPTQSPDAIKGLQSYRTANKALTGAHMLAITVRDSGLRASEALGLNEADIDLDNLALSVKGMGSKYRLVPFSAELRKYRFRLIHKEQRLDFRDKEPDNRFRSQFRPKTSAFLGRN